MPEIEPFEENSGHTILTNKCEHTLKEGCMWCCTKCDTDTHRCYGCGDPVAHEMSEVCMACVATFL